LVASKVSAVSSVPDRKDRRSRMKQVIIMQGLSGSGKTTLAQANYPNATVVSADRFFVQQQSNNKVEYRFMPWLLGHAHAWCMNNFIHALGRGDSTIVVDNTNTERWEWMNYVKLAGLLDYKWGVIDMSEGDKSTDEELTARNVHGVPLEVIVKQRERYEHAKSEELLSYSQHRQPPPFLEVDPTAVYRRNNNTPKGKL
jgi:predicted kinase